MNIFYYISILLENVYRVLKAFVPAMVTYLVFPNLVSLSFLLILGVIMIGGILYEFKLTDFIFRSD